jgi:hypothetical protein
MIVQLLENLIARRGSGERVKVPLVAPFGMRVV